MRGNIAPDGAVMKPAAAEARLHKHTGPAIVFDSYPEMKAAVDDENLEVTGDHIMVFRKCRTCWWTRHARMGHAAYPNQASKTGCARYDPYIRCTDERNELRCLYPACCPQRPEYWRAISAVVQNGDMIEVDIAARSLNLLVDEAELEKRKANWSPPKQETGRGYQWMSAQHIQQADTGCDFDFLETSFGKNCQRARYFLKSLWS